MALVFAAGLSRPAAHGTLVVPMSIDDLARSSVAGVIGTVGGISSVVARNGNIYSLIPLSVEEVLSGDLPTGTITLKEAGGEVAGQRDVLLGAPRFQAGERVLPYMGGVQGLHGGSGVGGNV